MKGESPFWEKPLSQLSDQEWERLCDGCGNCCRMLSRDCQGRTDYVCPALNLSTARCSDYANRATYARVKCAQITPSNVLSLKLPLTCAYVLRALGKPLPEWHYLISGDREAVHKAGVSVLGKVVHEP